MYPREIASYNSAKHIWTFKNGSLIDFGYIDNEQDVYQYQSAEYDVIRFDELTHFTEYMYVYMISRCRGANDFPKRIKSSTNPGGVGHEWVKARFIDIGKPNEIHEVRNEVGTMTTRIFIPSFVTDNKYLMEADPDYIKRLDALPEKERKALKDGNWDIFDGQYFTEFDRKIHVIEPFEIPNEYVYKELYEPNLIVSKAAARILEVNGNDKIKFTYAPPDLWNRRNDTGKSACDIFRENGVMLRRSANNRVQGWYAVAEHIKQYEATDEQTGETYKTSKLKFFNTCINIIRTLPVIQHDEKNANDVAKEPHEFTHAPDALRGFCIERTRATRIMTDDERMYLESQEKRRKEGILGIAGAVATRGYMSYGG